MSMILLGSASNSFSRSPTVTYATDDFTGADGDAWNLAKWTPRTAAGTTYVIAANAGLATTGVQTYGIARADYMGMSSATGSCVAVVTFTPQQNAVEQYLTLTINGGGSGSNSAGWEPTNCYEWQLTLGASTSTATGKLKKFSAGSSSTYQQVNGFAIDSTQPIRLLLSRNGTAITASAWNIGAGQPGTPTASGTETGTPLTGYTHIGATGGAVSASRAWKFDDFLVTNGL